MYTRTAVSTPSLIQRWNCVYTSEWDRNNGNLLRNTMKWKEKSHGNGEIIEYNIRLANGESKVETQLGMPSKWMFRKSVYNECSNDTDVYSSSIVSKIKFAKKSRKYSFTFWCASHRLIELVEKRKNSIGCLCIVNETCVVRRLFFTKMDLASKDWKNKIFWCLVCAWFFFCFAKNNCHLFHED